MEWNRHLTHALAACALFASALGAAHANDLNTSSQHSVANNSDPVATLSQKVCGIKMNPGTKFMLNDVTIQKIHQSALDQNFGAEVLATYCDAIRKANDKFGAYLYQNNEAALSAGVYDVGAALGHLTHAVLKETVAHGTLDAKTNLANSLGVNVSELPKVANDSVSEVRTALKERDAAPEYINFNM